MCWNTLPLKPLKSHKTKFTVQYFDWKTWKKQDMHWLKILVKIRWNVPVLNNTDIKSLKYKLLNPNKIHACNSTQTMTHAAILVISMFGDLVGINTIILDWEKWQFSLSICTANHYCDMQYRNSKKGGSLCILELTPSYCVYLYALQGESCLYM